MLYENCRLGNKRVFGGISSDYFSGHLFDSIFKEVLTIIWKVLLLIHVILVKYQGKIDTMLT